MDEIVIYINHVKIVSKKDNKAYYFVEYLGADNRLYSKDFITEEQYNAIEKLNPSFLEQFIVTYKIGNNRKLSFNSFRR